MRAIVFSDVHGRGDALERIFETQPDADVYIFLGDGMREVNLYRKLRPELNIITTPGNCDSLSADGSLKTIQLGGVTLAYCHGHKHRVKSGLTRLKLDAEALGAKVVLFGHTHIPVCEYVDRVYFLNPGSAASGTRARFAIVDVIDGSVACSATSVPLAQRK